MTFIYDSTIGSGCTPHLRDHPTYQGSNFANTFPGLGSKDQLRTRRGDGVVIINLEDLSVSLGLRAQAITVGASAVPLPTTPLEFRRTLAIHNNSSNTIYIGLSNVTTSTGYPILPGADIAIDCKGNAQVAIYAISTTDSDVRILELA